LYLERKHRLRANARRQQMQAKAHLHYRHGPGTYQHIHGHASADIRPKVEVWSSRHKRAGDEDRVGPSITATRLISDDEVRDDEMAAGLKMTAVKYTPEELPKRSTPRR
jgi:hypothetical protein